MSVIDFKRTRTQIVNASPAAAVETIIAILPGMQIKAGGVADFEGTCDVIIGTGGTGATLRIRRGLTVAGAVIATFGPFLVVAANRNVLTIGGTDTFVTEKYNQPYILTLQVTAASAVSTVNAVYFGALY